jgi:acetyl esterase/lipase
MLLERVVMPTKHAADPDGWSRASPRSWVNPEAPPFCVVHGTHDNMAPLAQARAFADALRAVSEAKVHFVEVPYAHHAYEVFHSPRATATARGVYAFLEEVRRA